MVRSCGLSQLEVFRCHGLNGIKIIIHNSTSQTTVFNTADLSKVTHPRSKGRQKMGLETRIGLKVNLQPKLKTESLMNDTETIGL
jgi:hypothetical protein